MLKNFTRDITLSIQARSGMSAAVLVWMAVIVLAAFTAFVFLCVAAYAWLAPRFDNVIAGLIMAGVFVVVAVIAALIAALIRQRVRERAILARAARAHSPSWLLDPRLLGIAVEAGRSIGWQRIVPVAVLGFIAAQWMQETRGREKQQQQQSPPS
jgi:hypothetical protein